MKDFLQDRLHLPVEEFNTISAAGVTAVHRRREMLEKCTFAFLVMTAEDETPDGKLNLRSNIFHEAGLFQGKLGFEKAIIFLKEVCKEFADIYGLIQKTVFIKYCKFRTICGVLERKNHCRVAAGDKLDRLIYAQRAIGGGLFSVSAVVDPISTKFAYQ